ncbi:MAG: DUF6106 family protein [Oscillospiraceae bacterium]
MSNYNMDVFVEQLVKKKISTKDILIYVGIFLAGTVIIFAGIFLLLPLTGQFAISFFVLVGTIFGAYYLLSRRNLEYEYAVTNGDVSVDKIINRKSRKRLTSFDAKTIEEMGKYAENAEKLKNRRVDKRIFASAYEDGRDSIYVIAQSKKTGLTLIVFNPDERVLDAIKPYVQRYLRNEFFGR